MLIGVGFKNVNSFFLYYPFYKVVLTLLDRGPRVYCQVLPSLNKGFVVVVVVEDFTADIVILGHATFLQLFITVVVRSSLSKNKE